MSRKNQPTKREKVLAKQALKEFELDKISGGILGTEVSPRHPPTSEPYRAENKLDLQREIKKPVQIPEPLGTAGAKDRFEKFKQAGFEVGSGIYGAPKEYTSPQSKVKTELSELKNINNYLDQKSFDLTDPESMRKTLKLLDLYSGQVSQFEQKTQSELQAQRNNLSELEKQKAYLETAQDSNDNLSRASREYANLPAVFKLPIIKMLTRAGVLEQEINNAKAKSKDLDDLSSHMNLSEPIEEEGEEFIKFGSDAIDKNSMPMALEEKIKEISQKINKLQENLDVTKETQQRLNQTRTELSKAAREYKAMSLVQESGAISDVEKKIWEASGSADKKSQLKEAFGTKSERIKKDISDAIGFIKNHNSDVVGVSPKQEALFQRLSSLPENSPERLLWSQNLIENAPKRLDFLRKVVDTEGIDKHIKATENEFGYLKNAEEFGLTQEARYKAYEGIIANRERLENLKDPVGSLKTKLANLDAREKDLKSRYFPNLRFGQELKKITAENHEINKQLDAWKELNFLSEHFQNANLSRIEKSSNVSKLHDAYINLRSQIESKFGVEGLDLAMGTWTYVVADRSKLDEPELQKELIKLSDARFQYDDARDALIKQLSDISKNSDSDSDFSDDEI